MLVRVYDVSSLQGKTPLKVTKSSKVGVASSISLANGVTLDIHFSGNETDSRRKELEGMVASPITISASDINDMNIILNDHDCSDSFFQEVVRKLKEDGIEVGIARGCQGINHDNTTVVTIDQQYNAGVDAIIFSPYDNVRIGHSDSLALSMQRAFQQNGSSNCQIVCGKNGFREDETGNVQTQVPTDTENAIDADCEVSFVTIALGTQPLSPTDVSYVIENGLARQKCYLNSDDNQTDLIYRASSSDSVDVVANYFGTDTSRLLKRNILQDGMFSDSQPVINPYVDEMKAFDANRLFQVGSEKEHVLL